MDVYLPLRIQHQISETVKDSLSKNGQYMLGVVNGMICNKLRERVINDIGNPKLKQRCWEVLNQLELDKDILTKEQQGDIKAIKIKEEMRQEELRKLQNPIIKVDVKQYIHK